MHGRALLAPSIFPLDLLQCPHSILSSGHDAVDNLVRALEMGRGGFKRSFKPARVSTEGRWQLEDMWETSC